MLWNAGVPHLLAPFSFDFIPSAVLHVCLNISDPALHEYHLSPNGVSLREACSYNTPGVISMTVADRSKHFAA